MKFVFSLHALEQMKLRQIPKEVVEKILLNPQQTKKESGKKSINQSSKSIIMII